MTLAGVVYAFPDNISANFCYPQLTNAHDQALGLTGVCLETSQCAGGLNDGLVGFYTNGDCPNGKAFPAISGKPRKKEYMLTGAPQIQRMSSAASL